MSAICWLRCLSFTTMVYNADVRRNTRQFKRLVIMTEANALTMTAAEIKEAQALQSDFFQSIPIYLVVLGGGFPHKCL